jgi:hypothetical protein
VAERNQADADDVRDPGSSFINLHFAQKFLSNFLFKIHGLKRIPRLYTYIQIDLIKWQNS